MRIISGTYKSRILAEPKGHVAHPMGERVRAALFNILHDVSDKTVLDAYAGSGALAIEAVSRGAKSAVAVEKDFRVYQVLKKNVEDLKLDQKIKTTRANVFKYLENNTDKYDIIFADPPYDKYNPAKIRELAEFLKDNGMFVLSHPSDERPPVIESLELVSSSDYGNAALAIYS